MHTVDKNRVASSISVVHPNEMSVETSQTSLDVPFRWVVVRSTPEPIVVNLPDDLWNHPDADPNSKLVT
jgi:hypothetical protein